MSKAKKIKRIAVLGSGVMGSQIAAHCVNAGIETLLYDMPSEGENKNALLTQSISRLSKLKPAPLASPNFSHLIKLKNYDENLSDLSTCDLIIEAIAENMQWKKDLYHKIGAHIHKESILASNTSGLSINALCAVLPESIKSQFCGIHFFNPPRYMHLAELIPSKDTQPQLLDDLETWLVRYLGKGVVRTKDTPNFIANRIGVFSLLVTQHYANVFSISPDTVDALTGTLLGRPKSATYRTMDVVGLDTLKHVVNTMHSQLEDDPWHHLFHLPDWLEEMINKGDLGQKSGQGVYRKNNGIIEVYNPDTKNYQQAKSNVSETIESIFKIKDHKDKMHALFSSEDTQAQFLTSCLKALFAYCAFHLESIAFDVSDIDNAICWGFGWKEGPFLNWQNSGFKQIKKTLVKSDKANIGADITLPNWLDKIECFYDAEKKPYSPKDQQYKIKQTLPVYQRQSAIQGNYTKNAVFETKQLGLYMQANDIAVATFRTKSNTLGTELLDSMNSALEYANTHCQGLIVYQNNQSMFSAGANLSEIQLAVEQKNWAAIESLLIQFQNFLTNMQYSSVPVVAAVEGMVLGGGCEFILHCNGVVGSLESYVGLVEAGVGVIPAGGGSKEMAKSAAKLAGEHDVMLWLESFFKNIATARVSQSIVEARDMRYVKSDTSCIMNRNEILNVAIDKIKYLQSCNYQAPLSQNFKVAGREGRARLELALANWKEGAFISEHDYFIASKLAYVLCGGDVYANTVVSEKWIYQLEREAFMELIQTPKTQNRISHMLKSGKPLRN